MGQSDRIGHNKFIFIEFLRYMINNGENCVVSRDMRAKAKILKKFKFSENSESLSAIIFLTILEKNIDHKNTSIVVRVQGVFWFKYINRYDSWYFHIFRKYSILDGIIIIWAWAFEQVGLQYEGLLYVRDPLRNHYHP